jgi:hypothetical protein
VRKHCSRRSDSAKAAVNQTGLALVNRRFASSRYATGEGTVRSHRFDSVRQRRTATGDSLKSCGVRTVVSS